MFVAPGYLFLDCQRLFISDIHLLHWLTFSLPLMFFGPGFDDVGIAAGAAAVVTSRLENGHSGPSQARLRLDLAHHFDMRVRKRQ